jgi:hypothetical protein
MHQQPYPYNGIQEKITMSREEEDKESMEPDYEEDKGQLEEKQQEETKEIDEGTTTNEVS